MTKLMEQVVAEVSNLPDAEQDAFAREWLERLREDAALEARLEAASDPLSRMALEALREDRAGQTRPIEELCANEVASQ